MNDKQNDYVFFILDNDQALEIYEELEQYFKAKRTHASLSINLTHSLIFVRGNIDIKKTSEEEYIKIKKFKRDQYTGN